MPLAIVGSEPRMSGTEFRAFQAARPDHERWELIEGVPVMMTPPRLEHTVIATNLQTLLNTALGTHEASRYAAQRPGVELPWPPAIRADMEKQGGYRPEPDVAVVDHDAVLNQARFTDRADLLAEVVSGTDEDLTPIRGERWIDVKVRLYRAHTPCQAILVVDQERVCVVVHARDAGEGWVVRILTGANDPLAIPSAGLACRVGRLYRDTHWQPRPTRTRRTGSTRAVGIGDRLTRPGLRGAARCTAGRRGCAAGSPAPARAAE